MKAALALAAALGSACAAYPGRDVAMENSVVVLMAADMATTYTATEWCTEANPIIGRCGQRMPVALYFAAVTGLHILASRLIPEGRWRTAFQAAFIGLEGHTVYRNTLAKHRKTDTRW